MNQPLSEGSLNSVGQPAPNTVSFGNGFLDHHVGSIISDPSFALVELVANCWDAGATKVELEWPATTGQQLSIKDNGIGMTHDEFTKRWSTLNYNRVEELGLAVTFPPNARKESRIAFGRNGIGRHAMFCFSNSYYVETKKNGKFNLFSVKRSFGPFPFIVKCVEKDKIIDKSETGTYIYTEAEANINILNQEKARDLIGCKFVANPSFKIYVNETEVTLEDLEHLCDSLEVEIENLGKVKLRRYDSTKTGRTSKQSGMAWWFNRRLVGETNWNGYDGQILDARTSIGKRFTYVIESDILPPKCIKPDWSGFYASVAVNNFKKTVSEFIREDINTLLSESRRERKLQALENNRDQIRRLPIISQEQVAAFAEEVQKQCPTMNEKDLSNTVSVLINLEKARSGYNLLEKLSLLSPNDLDGLDRILNDWNISDAKKILDELRLRLNLIKKLEKLIDLHTTDELHGLQPLFERGLWIFGPEFESASFTSNRTLTTVVETFFSDATLTRPNARPDFVMLENASIGLYSCPEFDERHEVSGFGKIIIVELKRGGFCINYDEKDQAMGYARQLRKSGLVGKSAQITCYVLGSKVDSDAEEIQTDGNTKIIPRTYNAVLYQAHARTFNLAKHIKDSRCLEVADEDLAKMFAQQNLMDQDLI